MTYRGQRMIPSSVLIQATVRAFCLRLSSLGKPNKPILTTPLGLFHISLQL